jgi:hypothetical protein
MSEIFMKVFMFIYEASIGFEQSPSSMTPILIRLKIKDMASLKVALPPAIDSPPRYAKLPEWLAPIESILSVVEVLGPGNRAVQFARIVVAVCGCWVIFVVHFPLNRKGWHTKHKGQNQNNLVHESLLNF